MAGNLTYQVSFTQADLEPILVELYEQGKTATREMFYTKIFGPDQTAKKQVETIANYASLTNFELYNSGQFIPQQYLREGYTTRYVHQLYGGIVGIAKETIDDGQYGVLTNAGKLLARSEQVTREIVAHTPLNLGFTQNQADGVPLFSAAHTLSTTGATTGANLVTAADPSITALDTMMTMLNYTSDSAGNPVMYRSAKKIWLVNPLFEATALQICNSTSTSIALAGNNAGAVNNNAGLINPFQNLGGQIEVVASPYITDNDSSYLIADGQHFGVFFVRENAPLNTWMNPNPRVMYTSKVLRLSSGFHDWRGIVGNPGA